MTAAQEHAPEWIELAGAHNVRDLGGLPAGGRRVRRGVLLRGDHLDDLTGADLVVVRDGIGLRALVDLRSADELDEPREWVSAYGIARLHLPLIDLTGFATRTAAQVRPDELPAVYADMLEEAAPGVAAVLRFLLEDGHTPALVHCAAGKDRTGITVAVLLAAAGVDEPAIVADYVATGERLDRIHASLARRAIYRDMVRPGAPTAGVVGSAIEGVLAALRAFPGGPQGFLEAHGAPPGAVQAWRDLLLAG
ncbi:MAG: protein tyrosine/serine phosphatase [Frankiales bacterium]|nr:protein tyrosine/serine phosphatase [Frankiales bacterium]